MNYFHVSFYCIVLCLVSSFCLIGMQPQKPSIFPTTGNWEEADTLDREKNIASESLSLIFRNTNSVPLTLKFEHWTVTIPAGMSLQKICLAATPLEIVIHNKYTRCQIQDILSFRERAYLPFFSTSKELFIKLQDDYSIVINNALTLPLKSLPTETTQVDDSSDSSSIISFESIDSPVARPKSFQELLGILNLTENS